MALDWDKLRIFHAVASAGSFTHGGETLGLSQSAVSRQISALEDSLGVTLFHRHARGLVLTEQGELLFNTAQDMFGQMARVQGQLMDSKDLAQGPLTVTAPTFIGARWLTPLLKNFSENNSGIRLNLTLDDRVLNLALREADAAIRLRKPEQQDLIQRHLTDIQFHMCASNAYLEHRGTPKNAADLKNHTLLSYPSNIEAPYVDASILLKIAGINESIDTNMILMNSINGIFNAVRQGVGIAFLPDYLIAQSKNIKIILPEILHPNVEMYFVYPEEFKKSKRLSQFRNFLLEVIEFHKKLISEKIPVMR